MPFGIFHNKVLADRISINSIINQAELGDILRCHDGNYILNIQKICESLPPGLIRPYDGDTAVSYESWEASLKAVGAVITACESVIGGSHRNAFCPVRPPGHHSGMIGVVDIEKHEL